jgi:hypothetical protein
LFRIPEFEPPPGEPSWAVIGGLVAAAVICAIVILVVSGCGSQDPCKELVGVIKGIPIFRDKPGCVAP